MHTILNYWYVYTSNRLTHKILQITQRDAHHRDETLKRNAYLASDNIEEAVNGKTGIHNLMF